MPVLSERLMTAFNQGRRDAIALRQLRAQESSQRALSQQLGGVAGRFPPALQAIMGDPNITAEDKILAYRSFVGGARGRRGYGQVPVASILRGAGVTPPGMRTPTPRASAQPPLITAGAWEGFGSPATRVPAGRAGFGATARAGASPQGRAYVAGRPFVPVPSAAAPVTSGSPLASGFARLQAPAPYVPGFEGAPADPNLLPSVPDPRSALALGPAPPAIRGPLPVPAQSNQGRYSYGGPLDWWRRLTQSGQVIQQPRPRYGEDLPEEDPGVTPFSYDSRSALLR